MFSPSDLGKDSKRTRLSRSSPRTPVFSILNQSLLAGIAVSRYVIKLGITIHNVFSWWARVKKEKKNFLIFLIMLRLKYPLPYYLQVIHLSLNVPFVYFAFFKYVRHTCICSVMSFRHTHIFFLKKKKKSILLKSILGFLSFKKRYLYDNIKL